MGSLLQLATRGKFREFADTNEHEQGRAVTTVIGRKQVQILKSLRRQISRAGLGERLGNALRGQTFPSRGFSISARGIIQSNALARNRSGTFDILQVFEQGARIRARQAQLLAIPTDEARRLGPRRRGRPTPSDFPQGSLTLIPHGRRPRLVLRESPEVTVFVLVPEVRIRKRLKMARTVTRSLRNTNELIARTWARRMARVERRLSA